MGNNPDSFDFDKLPEILMKGTDQERRVACDRLVEIGETAVEPILTYLKFFGTYGNVKDPCDALVRIGEPAIEPLSKTLREGSPSLRRIAVDLLVKISGKGAISQLVTALADSDPGTALAALDALAELAWQPADPALQARRLSVLYLYSARRVEGSQRPEAAEQLRSLQWEPGNDEVAASYFIANQSWEKCVELGLPAVKPLFITLQDPDDEIAAAAAKTLVQIGNQGVEQLMEMIDNYYKWSFSDASSLKLRTTAAGVLGQIGDDRAVPILIKIGSRVEKTTEIREAAADALGAIGAGAIDFLIKASSSDQAAAQHLAALALGKLGDSRAIPVLIPLLSASGPHHQPFVRTAAREALVTISGEDHGAELNAWQSWLENKS